MHPSDILLTFPCSSLIQSVVKSCPFKLCNTLSPGRFLPFVFPSPLPCCTVSNLHPFCPISQPVLRSTFWDRQELSGALPQVQKTSMASHCLTDKQHISSRDCRAATNSSQLSFLKQMLLVLHPYPFSPSWKSPTDLVESCCIHWWFPTSSTHTSLSRGFPWQQEWTHSPTKDRGTDQILWTSTPASSFLCGTFLKCVLCHLSQSP